MTYKDQTINVYQESLTPKELASLRRKLAKRANQRLVRLERATSKVTGETYAGIGASEHAFAYLNRQAAGKKRFTENITAALSYDEMRREVTVLQGFLEAKTSQVKGIRDIEKKRIKTFESGEWGNASITGQKQRKLKFASTKEFFDFFSSSIYKDLSASGFTSEQIIESYDEARETYNGHDDEALEALEAALEKFRERGKATLKDLRAAAGGKALS